MERIGKVERLWRDVGITFHLVFSSINEYEYCSYIQSLFIKSYLIFD